MCSSPQAVPFFTDTHFSDTFPRRIERIRVISWNLLHGKTNGFFLRFFGKGMVYQSQVFFFSAAALPLPGTVWQQPADSLQIVPDPMYLCQDGRCSGVQKALSVFLTGMRQHVSGIGIMAVGSVADHTGWLVCDTEITVIIENRTPAESPDTGRT